MKRCIRGCMVILCCLTGLSEPASAQQLKSFSGDSTKFISELHQLFSHLGKDDQRIVQTAMVPFLQSWESEQFNAVKKKAIYSISKKMLKKRMRAFPDFYNFLRALNAYIGSRQSDRCFYDWASILEDLADSKYSRHFLSFVEFSIHLFSENLIYQSSSTEWRMAVPEYRFIRDTIPMMEVTPKDLICYSNRDSLKIYDTRGIYYPLETRWEGNGGKVDWQRAGLDPARVFATLGHYDVQMKFSKYEADSVDFFNTTYFQSPLPGKLIDKVQADVGEEKASYPRFYSYENLIGIRDIFKDVDYLGGFSMEGQKVVGFGVKGRDAEVTFRRNDREFISVRSKTFVIRPDRINSANASVTILYENDSIYHPGLVMKYMEETRELTLNKDERVAVMSPWFDTWHNLEIYCEALSWKLQEPKIQFEAMHGPGSSSKAVFESANYYSLDRYEKLKGIDELNPLQVIKNFTGRRKSREFTLNELVEYWKMPPAQVESQLLLMGVKGYLIYDADDKTAVVKDKLFHYVDASNEKTDYDGITISSETEGKSNAVLNLENFDLKLQGVPGVYLSDSQHVYIEPRNQELILKQNRDFVFSGKVEAGLFDFYARDCSFDYGKFRLNLPAIDSLEFYVLSHKINPTTGKYELKKVQTPLNDLNGFLLIDQQNNKSGLKNFPEFPVFTNQDTAKVNWDKPYIHKGVYDKEQFYFDVLPFTLNSLDYIDTDSLQFDGKLVSAGIFPDITEPLKIRPDYSLGLEKTTELSGTPVYGGKGTFVSRIDLSNQGLHGEGELFYLNSTTASPDYLFFPDSMSTLARQFQVREQMTGVEYPSVQADSVREFWLPYRDSMTIATVVRDMSMYNAQSAFSGTLGLTPALLSGSGTVKIKDAEMDSKGFDFRQHTFDALIADFRIKSYNLNELAISTQNYRTHFDFELRRGEFRSNLGISRMEFPLNKYICSMDRFDWMIDHEEIILTNEENLKYSLPDTLSLSELIDVGYTGTEFMSIHPRQDSLRFFALRARFNIRTNVINAEEVRIIKVADAAIYPDSGKIKILQNAVMTPLRNANIIANTSSRHHNFYNATINILGRKQYTAAATYDYADRSGERQQIEFAKIGIDTAGHTVAEGQIPPTSDFHLSPEFAFSGNVSLKAPRKNLLFTGTFKAMTECLVPAPDWVRFSSEVNPLNVRLPVSDPILNRASEKLMLALLYSTTGGHIYPAFFVPRRSFSDSVMITTSGLIDYQVTTSTFRTGPEDRLKDPAKSGSVLSLNTGDCRIHAEGKINLGLNSGPLRMETWGSMDYFIIPDSGAFRLGIVLDFPFDDQVMERVRKQINATNLPGIQLFNAPYGMLLSRLVEEKEFEKLKSEFELVGKFRRFPDALAKRMVLADVKLSYDSVSRSYVSHGTIGIGNIGDQPVNRYLNGKIELSRKRNGDEFTFYLEISPGDWYFFNYRNNILQFLSSDLNLNDRIKEAQLNRPEQKRLDNLWKGYRYTLSTDRKKRDFMRRFNMGED